MGAGIPKRSRSAASLVGRFRLGLYVYGRLRCAAARRGRCRGDSTEGSRGVRSGDAVCGMRRGDPRGVRRGEAAGDANGDASASSESSLSSAWCTCGGSSLRTSSSAAAAARRRASRRMRSLAGSESGIGDGWSAGGAAPARPRSHAADVSPDSPMPQASSPTGSEDGTTSSGGHLAPPAMLQKYTHHQTRLSPRSFAIDASTSGTSRNISPIGVRESVIAVSSKSGSARRHSHCQTWQCAPVMDSGSEKRAGAHIATVHLHIGGMTCGACVQVRVDTGAVAPLCDA